MRKLAAVCWLWVAVACREVVLRNEADAAALEVPSPSPARIETQYGPVLGVSADSSRVFRSIPYARAPVGALRFASPEPPEPWQEPPAGEPVACPQLGAEGALVGTEDCLQLDVWTPLQARSRPLPAMVWIHGGGFTAGSGYLADALLPARDVLVVAINYRLGALGFLAHPALNEESAGSSGNYAIEDQRFALEWVRDNIAAFGGDPARVTIFGESAGGSAVCAHLWSPRSAGLFHRAILQSGALCGRQSRTLAQGEAQGERLAEAVGCSGAPDVADCLRALDPAVLLSALQVRTPTSEGAVWGPVVDGQVFERDLPQALAEGDFNRVPTIVGSNAQEGLGFLPGLEALTAEEYAERVRSSPFYGEHADALLAAYPAADFATPQLALAALIGHRVFNCPARRTARAIAAAGERAYLYLFAQAPAFHAGELAYLFGVGFSPSEQRISAAIKDYWTRFAATGDPNLAALPQWPRYEAEADPHLVIADPIHADSGLLGRECDVWDQFEP
jgi:para-nitrobenzyl esterase